MTQNLKAILEDLSAINNFGLTVNRIDGHYLFVNNFFCSMVGYSREELLKNNFGLLTHPDDLQKNIALDQLLRDGDIPFFQMKKRYFHKSGQLIHVLLQVGLLRGDEDVYLAMVTEIGDIVSGIESEQQSNSPLGKALGHLPEGLQYLLSSYEYINRYKEKNHRKSKHLANMVHELRTPLNIITGFSKRLERQLNNSDDAKLAKNIEYIDKGCTNLSQLISEILDFEMMESGSFKLEKERVELFGLISKTIDTLEAFASEHNLEIKYRNEFNGLDALNIDIDPKRIQILLHNLISNAIKYTEQGEINVTLSPSKDSKSFRLEVQDSGIGIAEKDFHALFDEYKKVNHKITKSVDSFGLGLPISKKIVEIHGGSISVNSELGVGTTFTVILPMA